MKRMMGIAAIALAAAICGCQSSEVSGPADPTTGEQHAASPSSTDREFVTEAEAGGTYEVQAGQLALQKSSDSHVRTVAQRMVTDHTKGNNQLIEIARRVGGPTVARLTPDQNKMITRLKGLQGSDFDQEYLRQQDQAHRDTIAKFEDEAKNGNNLELRSFASNTLPTLHSHLNLITGTNGNGMGTDR